MEKYKAERGKKAWVTDSDWVADLIAFEGPLVSLYRNRSGADQLVCWVDCDVRRNRWAIVEVSNATLPRYLKGELSLLSLFEAAETIVFYETDAELKILAVRILPLANVPIGYLPAHDSFLTADVATADAARLIEEDTEAYDLLLDGDWYLDQLGKASDSYRQLYSFHYGLRFLSQEAVRAMVSRLLSSLPWRGGFSTVNWFNELLRITPTHHRPRIAQIQYASPGFIRLNSLPSVADSVAKSVRRLDDEDVYTTAQNLYSSSYKLFEKYKLTKMDHRDLREQLGDDYENVATAITEHLDGLLGCFALSAYKTPLLQSGANELALLKAQLSYFRRATRLQRYREEGLLELPRV